MIESFILEEVQALFLFTYNPRDQRHNDAEKKCLFNYILSIDTSGLIPFLNRVDYYHNSDLSSSTEFRYQNDETKNIDILSNVQFGTRKVCSLLVGNRFLLFGGYFEARQVLIVYSWGVQRIQSLPFNFEEGQCHHHEDAVYLCFQEGNGRSCHKTYVFHPKARNREM